MNKKILITLLLLWGIAISGVANAEDCLCPCECQPDPIDPVTYSDKIILNEILPNPSGADSEFEFIELKNIGEEDVCLTDWQLKDASEKIYKISADDYSDTTIKASGFFTVYASISKISLNNSGETVYLLHPDGVELENVAFAESAQEDYSFSRDSNSNWSWVTPPTPNAENVFPEQNNNNDVNLSNDIIINEIYPDPADSEIEFIELKNKGDKKINLTGWQLSDATDKKFTLSAEIEKYYTVYGNDTKISLNNDGDLVKLYKPDGSLAQSVEYAGGAKGQSYSYKDAKWHWTDKATPNSDNIISGSDATDKKYYFSDKVVISELLPDPEGSDTQDEFIEIYNGDSQEMDLFGWSLSDLSRTFLFAESVKIKANEYKAFYITETKVSLNNLGETITLKDPEEKIMSEVSYPKSRLGYSYNLDGAEWVWSSQITPNESNEIVEPEEENMEEASDEYPLLSIQEAREQEKDAKVSVEGVVTVLPNILGSQYFYIQDAASGIQIYSSQKLFPDLKVGDLIRVKGKISEAYNEKRINISSQEDIKILDSGQDLDAITVESLDEDIEGRLASTESQILELTTTKITLANGVIVYIKANVDFDKSKYQEGQVIKVTGIVSQYKEEYRLLIRSAEDIESAEAASGADGNGLIKAAYAEEAGNNFSLDKLPNNKKVINYLLITIGVLAAAIIFILYKTGIIKNYLLKIANRAAGAEKNTKGKDGPSQCHG